MFGAGEELIRLYFAVLSEWSANASWKAFHWNQKFLNSISISKLFEIFRKSDFSFYWREEMNVEAMAVDFREKLYYDFISTFSISRFFSSWKSLVLSSNHCFFLIHFWPFMQLSLWLLLPFLPTAFFAYICVWLLCMKCLIMVSLFWYERRRNIEDKKNVWTEV